MKVYLVIQRHFYERGFNYVLGGEQIMCFMNEAQANYFRNDVRSQEKATIQGCSEFYEDELDRWTINRPNGSKLEIEIQESLVRHQNFRDVDKYEQWREGLWEDYYAGRISDDSLLEELAEIDEMEKNS